MSEPDVVYGLMSTVGDMYRFDKAVHSGRVIPVEKLPAHWLNHIELGHGPHGTADGWYTADTHRGGDDDVVILAFSNMSGGRLPDLEAALFFAAIDWPPARITVEPDLLARYVGRYRWRDSYFKRLVTIVVQPHRDGLLRIHWNRWPPRIHGVRIRPLQALIAPYSERRFFVTRWLAGSAGPGWTFEFEVGADGQAKTVVAANKAGMARTRYRRVG